MDASEGSGAQALPSYVLCLSGFDPSGAAGLLRDLWTIERMSAKGKGLPTCLTVQNDREFRASHKVSVDYLLDAFDALCDQAWPMAIKSGLVDDAALWRALLPKLRECKERGIPIVVDPVLASSKPGYEASSAVRQVLVEEVMALGVILTPNLPELFALAGTAQANTTDAEEGAARVLLGKGASAVLVKGGHRKTDEGNEIEDHYYDTQGSSVFRRPRLGGPARRGTGCVFATLMGIALAEGKCAREAAREAGRTLWCLWSELDGKILPDTDFSTNPG